MRIIVFAYALTVFYCGVGAHAAGPKTKRAKPELEIRIIFDNTSAREDLRRSWGFSALIDFRGHRVLFDAGSDPILLLKHMELMHIDPKTIEHAVISHQHSDHLRGVYWVFEKNPAMTVHFLDCFPEEAFRRAKAVKMKPKRVTGPFEVVPGIYSTGIVKGLPPEQSLVMETSAGPVMLVGCSHPGVVKLVETVQRQRKKKSVRLLLGGLHMLKKRPEQIRSIIKRLVDLKVVAVIPAHCSGDLAKELFQNTYGKQFNTAGAGRYIVLEGGRFAVSTLPVEPTSKQSCEIGVGRREDLQLPSEGEGKAESHRKDDRKRRSGRVTPRHNLALHP